MNINGPLIAKYVSFVLHLLCLILYFITDEVDFWVFVVIFLLYDLDFEKQNKGATDGNNT